MNITSNNTMIFAKEFNGKIYYRAGISTKDKYGKYISAYIDVKLPKGDSLPNKTKINITSGFLSFYKDKDNKDNFYIVIQTYTMDVVKEEKQEDIYANFGNSITVEELDKETLDLPF